MYTSLQEQETQLQILQFFKFSERTDSSRGWPHIKLYCISTSLLKFWLERLGRVGQKSVNTISVLKFNQGKNCSSIKMLSTSYIGSQYFHVAIRDSPQKMKEGAMLLQGWHTILKAIPGLENETDSLANATNISSLGPKILV